MSIRRPAVAGMFYSADASELRAEVDACFRGPGGPGVASSERLTASSGEGRVLGLVSPHAGYVYSGSVAANAYKRLAEDGLPDVAVVIGPNHRSYEPAIALTDDEAWLTPLGEVPLDRALIYDIAAIYPEAVIDRTAHMAEHSLEVQVPFLQYIWSMADGQGSMGGERTVDGRGSMGGERMADGRGSMGDGAKGFSIVPILIGSSAWREEEGVLGVVRSVGSAVGKALEGRNAVIIASTDFTHYESSTSARTKDQEAISAIVALDEEALLKVVTSMKISMCGVLPTAVTIAACKELGAARALELAYRNSGDVTGDNAEVVGYAALEIDR